MAYSQSIKLILSWKVDKQYLLHTHLQPDLQLLYADIAVPPHVELEQSTCVCKRAFEFGLAYFWTQMSDLAPVVP